MAFKDWAKSKDPNMGRGPKAAKYAENRKGAEFKAPKDYGLSVRGRTSSGGHPGPPTAGERATSEAFVASDKAKAAAKIAAAKPGDKGAAKAAADAHGAAAGMHEKAAAAPGQSAPVKAEHGKIAEQHRDEQGRFAS